ncbi:PREDICTED: glycosyltransferase-like domain-containing protein 1 [Cyprinodon variegatus]|uniref:glycosyltransferase-like domain-containing protein 1 n=1 Tax=Cyprinodon variegatus TaxID=28743 RepID=UPI000742BE87|nr:PREDICTED: glycosyltransferase-like domain-containing protein 1 [Cyprinodon variegatus]
MLREEVGGSPGVLLVEAFYGGSHKQLIDLLKENIEGCSVFTLPAKKWHWRARTAALYFSQTIPACSTYRVLFSSSVLNLCELVALRPDLARLKKILYFHENQLVYPVRKDQERDFQYGYNQVLSCLVSDVVAFNSRFNMESFLSSIRSFMKKIPDHRPKDLDRLIRPKCVVLSYPVQFPDIRSLLPEQKLRRLCRSAEMPQSDHRIVTSPTDQQQTSWFGEVPDQSPSDPRSAPTAGQDPECLDQVKPLHIVWPHRWLEAVHCGCFPLCPKALVYPEIFPDQYLYSTPEQLCKRLQELCKRPDLARRHVVMVDTSLYSWSSLKTQFQSLLAAEGP